MGHSVCGWAFSLLENGFLEWLGFIMVISMVSQNTSVTIVCATVYSGADERKHQISGSLAYVWGIHSERWIPRTKGPVTWKMFPFDDVIMCILAMPEKGNLCPFNSVSFPCGHGHPVWQDRLARMENLIKDLLAKHISCHVLIQRSNVLMYLWLKVISNDRWESA